MGSFWSFHNTPLIHPKAYARAFLCALKVSCRGTTREALFIFFFSYDFFPSFLFFFLFVWHTAYRHEHKTYNIKET